MTYTYRYIAIIAALMCCMTSAWGQVTGDKYTSTYLLEDNNVVENVIIKAQNGATVDGTNSGASTIIGTIFDTNDTRTYWRSSVSGSLIMDIDRGSSYYHPLCSLSIVSGSRSAQRPTSITIEQSDNDDYREATTLLSSQSISSSSSSISLTNPITKRYVRITLNANANSTIYLYGIHFYTRPYIRHKHAKWYEFRDDVDQSSKNMDSFNDTLPMVSPNDNPFIENYDSNIQSAHTYVDTIYMHRGTSIEIELPDRFTNTNSIRSYQRWYSFRTDKTFETNHSDNVYDLLTPVQVGSNYSSETAVRFANGYVGNPVNGRSGSGNDFTPSNSTLRMKFYMPTVDEFNKWFDNTTGFDNRWFVVACDVSAYTDYTETYNKSTSASSVFFNGTDIDCWEPTLSHRFLFYISAVDGRKDEDNPNWTNGHGRLSTSAYQGGGTTAADKYLEEYTITLPYYRLNDKQDGTNFYDAIALSKDAFSYAIPDATNDNETLNVTCNDVGSSGIELKNLTVSDYSRLIQFTYPESSSDGDGMFEVNGDSATIFVTKKVGNTTYNIARYKLFFNKDVTLLPQSVIKELEKTAPNFTNSKWLDYKTRTPKYLNDNYQLITSLTWDYDDNISIDASSNDEYYFFPMEWDFSSYAFFDGSGYYEGTSYSYNNYKEFIPGAIGGEVRTNLYPEWGYYAITNTYLETNSGWGKSNTYKGTINEPEGGSFHMFIDVSNRPGGIATLPFDENLCSGSELFVSAWVKEAGWSKTSPGSGLMFTILGVTETGSKVPLYRYSTGQFRRTDYLSENIPGCGDYNADDNTNTNEWLHVYFSFINQSEVEYDSYMLQIDNNSVSSNGADMYLDAIRIYVAQPTAVVTQKGVGCNDEPTQMNIEFDWDRLMSRTGGKAVVKKGGETRDAGAINFCFVDQVKYYTMLDSLSRKNDADSVRKALDYAIVETGQGANARKFSQLHYFVDYDSNTEYGTDNNYLAADNMLIFNGESRGFFYRHTGEEGVKKLTVDFMSTLSPNKPYWILLDMSDTSGDRPTLDNFITDFDHPCGMRTEFYVEGLNQMVIEGEVVDPTLSEYCSGQLLNFHPNMRYTNGEKDNDGNTIYEVLDGVVYDWYIGSEEDYTAKIHKDNEGNDDDGTATFSIDGALTAFRDAYPDKESLPETYDRSNTDVMTAGFSEAMYDSLKVLVERGMLELSEPSLDLRLSLPGLSLVARPVKSSTFIDNDVSVCWSYIPLSLLVVNAAPTLRPGYSGISYPKIGADGTEEYSPNLRIGLAQIQKATDEDNALICNLRSSTVVSSTSTHVGRVTNDDSGTKIYLVDTDDPDMAAYLNSDDSYALPIGQVDYLRSYKSGTDYREPNRLRLHFDLTGELMPEGSGFKFTPREGYYYTFSVYFEEKVMRNGVSETATGNACTGIMHVTMYVVPEYVIWKGTYTDNWSNDGNWLRVNSADRIQRTTGTYEEYTESAFVPMQFSKVILPPGSKVELYVAGYDNTGGWNNDSKPGYIGERTDNIEYDLLVVEQPTTASTNAGRLTTERYRAYWIDKLHFEPGAQMRGAEYLIYDGAEIDYELEPNKWHQLTSPLQGTVAGDFYTDVTTARETGEYFKGITFNAASNSRLSPYVFQRDWDATSAQLMTVSGTENNVGITGNWSGVYNDVAEYETYRPGCGFSLKVTKLPSGATDGKALFRLPKADESYSYYDTSGNVSTSATAQDVKDHRTDYHGHLITDSLFHRVAYDYTSSEGKPITINLPTTSKGTYYMIGNPFMTNLNVKKFFETNNGVIEQKYWKTNSDLAAAGTATGWVSSDDEGTDVNIGPLEAFFVKKIDDATGDQLTLTQEMQASFADDTQTSGARSGVLHLTATAADGQTGSAAVVYDDNASAGYGDAADVMLFMDPACTGRPRVYTVGDTRALAINAAPPGSRIPLGVSSDATVTLSFSGVAGCGDVQLYDAANRLYTTLTDDYTLTVSPADAGRYYLTGGGSTGISSVEETTTQSSISIYSARPGEITVTSSGAPLASVLVCGVGGRHCGVVVRQRHDRTYRRDTGSGLYSESHRRQRI